MDDAQQDLAREGGDERANLQRAQERHQAVRQGSLPLGRIAACGPPGTLREQIQQWFSLGARRPPDKTPRKKALTLSAEHNALEGKLGARPPPLPVTIATMTTRPPSSPSCGRYPTSARP